MGELGEPLVDVVRELDLGELHLQSGLQLAALEIPATCPAIARRKSIVTD